MCCFEAIFGIILEKLGNCLEILPIESLWFKQPGGPKIYLERARIFLRLRLSLRIRFLRHCKWKETKQID